MRLFHQRLARLSGDGIESERLDLQLARMLKQFPECTGMVEQVRATMERGEGATWHEMHKAALYAASLNAVLRAMAVFEGDVEVAAGIQTGCEDILNGFYTGR